jgi:hypothetical protein
VGRGVRVAVIPEAAAGQTALGAEQPPFMSLFVPGTFEEVVELGR